MDSKLASSKKLSVVIPCYNEAENIRELHVRLSKVLAGITSRYEIIFVDNKSTDNSDIIFRELSVRDPNVSVIFFSRNFGNSQYGYSAGTEYASGDAVIWMEGDLQDPPEVITKLVEKWLAGYEVVYGVRPKAVGSFFSRTGRQLFYRIFHKLSYLDIPRDAGDFSLLDRKVVDIFNAMPERSRFVRGLRAWIGFRHTGVEYQRSERKGGVTSNPSFRRNLWWAKKFIFSFSYAPLEFISHAAWYAAVFSAVISFIFVSFALIGKITWLLAFIAVTGFIFATIIIVSLAILAETLGIIFDEVKGRPKYIIREILNNHRV